MSADWPTIELGKLVDPARGISYGIVQPGHPVEDGVPIVRVANVRDGQIDTSSPLRVSPEVERTYSRTRLRGGELIITIVGTVGETAIVPSALAGWNVARAIAVLPVVPEIGAYWIKQALLSPAARAMIESRLNTTVQATLNLGDLSRLAITVPPRAEREAIASILGALDDKIELNRRMNETLEAMARAIFQDWFVAFGPTRAKMEDRPPDLGPDLWARFPDRLDAEGKPEGWASATLSEIAVCETRTCSPDEIASGTPYIALEHMPRRQIALGNWESADHVASGKLRFRRGEFLFGKLRPYFHKVGIAPIDGVCTTDAVVVRPVAPCWSIFVLMAISSTDFVNFTDRGSTGTKMPRTSWAQMARYPLVRPNDQAVCAYEAHVRPLVERILGNIHETQTLAATRDLLLPRLMSGELRVKDARRVVEAAA